MPAGPVLISSKLTSPVSPIYSRPLFGFADSLQGFSNRFGRPCCGWNSRRHRRTGCCCNLARCWDRCEEFCRQAVGILDAQGARVGLIETGAVADADIQGAVAAERKSADSMAAAVAIDKVTDVAAVGFCPAGGSPKFNVLSTNALKLFQVLLEPSSVIPLSGKMVV